MRLVVSACLACLLLFGAAGSRAGFDAAEAAARGNQPDVAIAELNTLLELPAGVDPAALRRAAWLLSDLYRLRGNNRAALATLEGRTASSEADIAQTAVRRGAALYGLGRYEEAASALAEARSRSKLLDVPTGIALSIEEGNVAVERGTFDAAFAAYSRAADTASANALPALEARARLNEARLRIDGKYLSDLETRLRRTGEVIESVPDTAERARLYLGLGELFQRAVAELGVPASWRRLAHAAFEQGRTHAGDDATRGYAYGFLGRLYEEEGRLDDGIALTRRALFFAQQAHADEQRYRWEWQLGRLLRAQGNTADAEGALGRAVSELEDVRSNFALGSRNTFNTRVAPVYTHYADALLVRSATMDNGEAKQATLRQVRDLLETLKRAEVEDYFANECVARTSDAAGPLATGNAAVIYPVLLDDRVELLVEAKGELAQFSTPVSRREITASVRRFRLNLERRFAGEDFLPDAQRLYRWLIAPAEAFLAARGIDTLVVVPEGALRTIPPAALHDGTKFLIERFAIALTPALNLTQNLTRPSVETMLIGGLTEGVQGFAPLAGAGREMDAVSALYPGRALRDATFELRTVEMALNAGEFSVAHFATHGEFSPDYRQSFILTYDDRLTLNALKQVLENRVSPQTLDLLVLSACKTAAGDDRAALGLAGVAVQSGAQSALASLWYVSDTATAQLIEQFYDELKSTQSKAQSLRQAQLALLASQQFRHPAFWAPYLLIGNWL